MRLLLPDGDQELGRNDLWALLPGLSCQVVGGELKSTIEISAAWLLLSLAGHLVDSVEDGDEVEEIDALGGPGSAINVANGYFLSAALMLNGLSIIDYANNQAHQINEDFYNTILIMTSGQHQDINLQQLSLKNWWQIAEAKTGSFFSLACRAGAQLGTDAPDKIAALSDFGLHLGLLLQIHDDMEDLQRLLTEENAGIPNGFERSLTLAYAGDVLPESQKSELMQLVAANSHESEQNNQTFDLLDQSGVGLYLLAEMESHYTSGINALQRADPLPPARDDLLEVIGGLKLDR